MDYAGVLIEREDGKLLFQLRDNNPNIKNRNCWSLFGGGINDGEKPINAVIRELKEELGLKVKKEQLRHLMTIPQITKKSYLFKLRLSKTKKLKLKEGTSFKYYTIPQLFKKKNIVSSLRLLLRVYPFISKIRGL